MIPLLQLLKDSTFLSSYHPISLLSVLRKILVEIINSRLVRISMQIPPPNLKSDHNLVHTHLQRQLNCSVTLHTMSPDWYFHPPLVNQSRTQFSIYWNIFVEDHYNIFIIHMTTNFVIF